ncbi:MAG: hypothetical protein GC168_20950 [Candidatus Hydrogenedens sp.]|nr:hypothetical protein [Candidatus Hydrogenedens sp.]
MFRKLYLCIAATVIAASGCQTNEQLSRQELRLLPEVYHPRTAAAAQVLSTGRPLGLDIDGPIGTLTPESTKPYTVTITDRNGVADTMIRFNPAVADAGVVSNDGHSKVFTIDPAGLTNLRQIEVTAIQKSGASATLTEALSQGMAARRKFNVGTIAPESNEKELLRSQLNVWPPDLAADQFGEHFAKAFYVCDAFFYNDSEDPIILYGASLEAVVRYGLLREDAIDLFGEKIVDNPGLLTNFYDEYGALADYLDFKEERRPMSFADVLGIFEYRREKDPRQQALRILQSLGTIGVGASPFVEGPDFDAAMAFFNGIFLPELEKRLLWDILMHLKQLESRSLKEVEEVPAGGALHRVVFFPRFGIPATNPRKFVYITEIRPDDATVDYVLIAKLGETEEARQAALSKIRDMNAVETVTEFADSALSAEAREYLKSYKVLKEKEAEEKLKAQKAQDAKRKAIVIGSLQTLLKADEFKNHPLLAEILQNILESESEGDDGGGAES